jgi:AraC-like DNA-binding protein
MSERILSRKLHNFSAIPDWLCCRTPKEISDGAKILYARLWRFMGDDDVCWPSIKRLQKELGKSASQTKRILKELKEIKLIKSLRIGKKCSNRYYLLEHEWMKDNVKAVGK